MRGAVDGDRAPVRDAPGDPVCHVDVVGRVQGPVHGQDRHVDLRHPRPGVAHRHGRITLAADQHGGAGAEVAQQRGEVVGRPERLGGVGGTPVATLVRLTDEGTAAITAVIDRERAVLRRAAGDLTEAEIAGCLRVLSHLLHFLDDVEVD
ncbi:hypothetical protein [Spongiactinospora gelatinilytica]|uniref:hypothetical protein n=1 Tax=Spongiactinospora gelatinilytica TaxID=2666298 RepID=UPI0018F41799|nr:hypothetical protein [Spongiactinospora gelatinilytica]